jgi:hypothetical protein
MTALPRIYFTTNDPVGDNRYGLHLTASLQDIASIGQVPEIGMRVLLYDVGEVEVQGTLDWDDVGRRCVGVPDWRSERWEY